MTQCDEFIITLKQIIIATENLKEQTHYLNDESLDEANNIVNQFNGVLSEIAEAVNDMANKIKQSRGSQKFTEVME